MIRAARFRQEQMEHIFSNIEKIIPFHKHIADELAQQRCHALARARRVFTLGAALCMC
jgi:hypothetical protein